MFRKILVAIDKSNHSERVLDVGMGLAKATGASLMLLHVLSHEEKGAPRMPASTLLGYPLDSRVFEEYQNQWQSYEKQGLDLLRSYSDKLASAGVEAEFAQHSGSCGRTICEIAHNWDAELIVIGRRGLSGLNEIIIGSVSNYVIHHAKCSVMTVQG